MADLHQDGIITTLHDFGTLDRAGLEAMLRSAVDLKPIGLVLPVTASDMRGAPFERIVDELSTAAFLRRIVVVLGVAPEVSDYREAIERTRPLGDRGGVLWTDSARVRELYGLLHEEGLELGAPGKGRSVWTAFGYLLAERELEVFALHDCDIVDYQRDLLSRLCLPMVHPSLNFEFCKAYYARYTDRLHGRVVRLLVGPLLRALTQTLGHDTFLDYVASFRYPLSGEFAVTASLARSNRIPSDWGLEVGTLAEVYRNTSMKRVCQVDICQQYEHKHQVLSDDPNAGLLKMARDIALTFFRTLGSMGVQISPHDFVTLRSAYLRDAQDAVRSYHADALMNGLRFDRHSEEGAIDGFAAQIVEAGQHYLDDPAGGQAIPNWSRVLAAFPDFPQRLRQAARDDYAEFIG